MCGHCGCQGVPVIGEPRDEHPALLEDAHAVRRALGAGDRPAAVTRLAGMVRHLTRHVEREELGIFPVSVVSPGAAGWATVESAHRDLPMLLTERTTA